MLGMIKQNERLVQQEILIEHVRSIGKHYNKWSWIGSVGLQSFLVQIWCIPEWWAHPDRCKIFAGHSRFRESKDPVDR